MGTNQGCSSLSRIGGQQEGICPMCMEEMDLTDQELQPCICGYEICLWCWHFIIQTATKDGRDARCPACHRPYDKEKILKRTISKERLEMVNANKKHKLQKNKQRLTNLGIDLNSIRVIRRNIVYIAGIPKSLSDEKTLRKKEYLGQYGKIVKIFFAQTDTSRLYYSSDSCIVYVTFSTEEEALCCIQVVNGYILDGRLLKASFGTTRYCYSWLNNLPCKNSDCLYVHDVVPREDICSREEVIPFCTSKLQQCPGVAFTNLKQHSGSFLPPPLETKNSLHLLGHMTNNRYIQSDDFGRSYASVAASHGQSKPSSEAEAYFPSNAEDHNHVSNAISSSRNEMPLAKEGMEKLSLAMSLVGICHSENVCSLDCKTATETNLVEEDNKCRSSFRDNHIYEGIIGEPLFSHSHGNSHLSTSQANVRTHVAATSLNSLTNIRKWKCESLGSVDKNNYSEWDDLGAVSRKCDPCLSLQALPGNSTSTPQNALPSYDWSRFHSDLGSAKFSHSFEDESLSDPFIKELKDFSTYSTIATNLCHKFDKPSSILPAKPMLFHGEQKKLCSRHSSNSSLDFEFTAIDKTRDEKFLIESYIEQCEDRILSDILTRDLDTIDDLGNKHCILEQLGSSDDFSRISNSSVPSAGDDSKSYFSMMEDLCGAIGQLSPWSNSASDLTKNSSCSEIMAEEQAYKDSFNKFYLETSKTSKVLNNTSLVSDTVLVSEFGSSLGSLSRPISQHPYSNSILRTTLSTPPGFPPRKTNPAAGIAPQSQPHNSFSARCFSNTKETSSSHSNSAENTSSAIFSRGEEQNLLKSSATSDATSRKNSQHQFFHHISNHQESSEDRFNPVSSNAADFGLTGRNRPTLTPISSVVPELQNRHLASYF